MNEKIEKQNYEKRIVKLAEMFACSFVNAGSTSHYTYDEISRFSFDFAKSFYKAEQRFKNFG